MELNLNDTKTYQEIILILSKHAGETGANEGAVETLNRIIKDDKFYMNLSNGLQLACDELREKAKKYDSIINEYNARWKSVVVHDKLKEYLKQLDVLIDSGQGITDPDLLVLLKAQIDIRDKLTKILESN